MTPQEMAAAAGKIGDRWPGAVITGNAIGNLKIDDDQRTGEYEYVGYVDCARGTVYDAETGDEL